MHMRYLINNNGNPFNSAEIKALKETLDSFDDDKRIDYRNKNASAIAQCDAVKFLIVSGPGTGKSHLFLDKIDSWCQKDPGASVIITSFVRKLVVDLQNDIENDTKLTPEQKNQIKAFTLHKFARSIVEINHGTTEWPFRPHIGIIGQIWKEIVWTDVLTFYPEINRSVYSWKKFEKQLHDNDFKETVEWKHLKTTYFKLCQFYNAAGFSDLILRATKALAENSDLNKDNYFIIDEYQDFNLAEECLINQLVENPKGLLIVGDDEQVLYEELKSGNSTLICNLYKNKDYANGMLPFCGRSSFHITKTVDHFIQQNRDEESIEKIYLPLKTNCNELKVQIIACATPPTAIDYIEKFVEDNKCEIDNRKKQLETGEEKEAFLLILTPAREVKFYRYRNFNGKMKLDELVSAYQTETRSFSEAYYQLLSYYSLANKPHNNFTFRKVFYYDGLSEEKVHELISKAIQDGKNFCDLDIREIKNVLNKCNVIKTIMDGENTTVEKLEQISKLLSIADKERLQKNIEQKAIGKNEEVGLDHTDEEGAELEEIEVKRMGAVELLSILGSKGLSAEHVIIIGFDNVNMKWITKNAFYVAMTRARKSLHILTALKSGGAKQTHNFLDQLSDRYIEYYSYTKSNRTKNPLQSKQKYKNYLNSLNW